MKGQGTSKWDFCLALLPKICGIKKCSLFRALVVAVLISAVSLVCLSYYAPLFQFSVIKTEPPLPSVKCHSPQPLQSMAPLKPKDHTSSASLRINNQVLVLVETQYSKLGQDIVAILEATRIKFRVEPAGKTLPYLTHSDKGKFGVIVFENLDAYTRMDKWNRQLLDKYCKEYNVGMIIFTPSKEDNVLSSQIPGFPLYIHTNLALKDFQLNANSDILRVTRAGEVWRDYLPIEDWTVFVSNHSTYVPLEYAKIQSIDNPEISADIDDDILQTVVIQDIGLYDGIRRVIFGNGFQFWLHRLLFLDSLSYLSHGKLSIPLDRYIQIDIDDIFVGKTGIRMKKDDVRALVQTQEQFQHLVPGFKFNLGFSGKYYHHGNPEEDEGDDAILANKERFRWFGHMWRHTQPHKYLNQSLLDKEMRNNFNFAKHHGLPVDSHYAIAPHHSGVYPVHEALYEAWKKVWNIKVTSTEEYPHLNPARYRRGFVHKGIMVLPRQTCGLFTHTLFLDKYPGGRQRLDNSIRGGTLFQAFLYNPINIFMTHLSNYGNDRLALYTFESAFKFVQCWTNLRLKTESPLEIGRMYFEMFPEEMDPKWQNPCYDSRHLEIWSKNKTCDRLPRFLVIGPQKTGTTALYSFLAMHPVISSNYKSPETFEEVQFFSGKNYYKGLDWYMNFFPSPDSGANKTHQYLFEKSATYFDKEMVPERAHALLPKAKLICILTSPAKRAYSWYYHMRAHSDPTALKYSFYEVVTAKEDAPKMLRDLRSRCLNPGLYAQHVERWLQYYNPNQLLILDGELLKTNPVIVMRKVQRFLHIEPYFDYSNHLKFDPKKGFYCQLLSNNHTKCLGRSKGRQYPQMDAESEKYLGQFYKRHNVAISRIMSRMGQDIPQWLQDDLKDLDD